MPPTSSCCDDGKSCCARRTTAPNQKARQKPTLKNRAYPPKGHSPTPPQPNHRRPSTHARLHSRPNTPRSSTTRNEPSTQPPWKTRSTTSRQASARTHHPHHPIRRSDHPSHAHPGHRHGQGRTSLRPCTFTRRKWQETPILTLLEKHKQGGRGMDVFHTPPQDALATED